MLRWLRDQAKGYDCSVCGANHSKSDIRLLGKLESAWIVRVTCSSCQTAFKLLVVLGEDKPAATPVKEERPRRPGRPAVTMDDVIDAHEALKDYQGDVAALFARRRRAVGAKTEGSRRT